MYQKHVFVCLHHRDGKLSCGGKGSEALFERLKAKVKGQGAKAYGIRINRSGCLGQCEHGPCLVVYPDGRWVTHADVSMTDEILNTYLDIK